MLSVSKRLLRRASTSTLVQLERTVGCLAEEAAGAGIFRQETGALGHPRRHHIE
jgi:hypothetical protein